MTAKQAAYSLSNINDTWRFLKDHPVLEASNRIGRLEKSSIDQFGQLRRN